MKFICKKCGSTDYKIVEKSNGNGIATGLYCAKCGQWQKWLNKQEKVLFADDIKDNLVADADKDKEIARLKAENAELKARIEKAAVIGAETDVRAIRALKSDFESTLLASYRSGKTLTECLAMLPILEKEKAASSEPADENAQVATVRLTVAGTKQQLAGLRDYMQAHGIKYELSFEK